MNPKIIFLTLNVANKYRVVCDIVEHEFDNGIKTIVNVADEEEGKTLDNMLWSWKQSTFIPHNYVNTLAESNGDPVILTTEISTSTEYSTLILVNSTDIKNLKNFSTIIDFAEKYNPTKLESDRKRYKLYRDQNYEIATLNPGEYLHK